MSITNYEYIDLGLPSGTLWAKYNVGATSETDYGNYYQYGKGADTYQVTSGQSDYSGIENPLAASADTATQAWGKNWHMPTQAQLEELSANTTYTWTIINDVHGGKFTAQNGNYIFIPASGYYDGGSNDSVGTVGGIWGCTPDDNFGAFELDFSDNGLYVYSDLRSFGASVRPVLTNYGKIINISKSSQTNSSTTVSNNGCNIVFDSDSWISNINIAEIGGSNKLSFTASENNSIARSTIIKPIINGVCDDVSKYILVNQETACDCESDFAFNNTSTVEFGAKDNLSEDREYTVNENCITSSGITSSVTVSDSWINASINKEINVVTISAKTNSALSRSGTVTVNYSEIEGSTSSKTLNVTQRSGCGCGIISTQLGTTIHTTTDVEESRPYNSSGKTVSISINGIRVITSSSTGIFTSQTISADSVCISSITSVNVTSNDSSYFSWYFSAYPSAPKLWEVKILKDNNTTEEKYIVLDIAYTLKENNPSGVCTYTAKVTILPNSCINTLTWL
jgi:hypothetical protein